MIPKDHIASKVVLGGLSRTRECNHDLTSRVARRGAGSTWPGRTWEAAREPLEYLADYAVIPEESQERNLPHSGVNSPDLLPARAPASADVPPRIQTAPRSLPRSTPPRPSGMPPSS